MFGFQRLDVYQRAVEFLALASEIAACVPRGNAVLLDQLRRAATSIPLNIAEGTGRTTPADTARSFAIARGSAMECAAALDALRVLKLVENERHRQGMELLERVVAMLSRMCRAGS
ncbi:MAG: four helix bundle protein [Archangiaceae bacterium]|nr:four helix bundle protein [Archangiaceae bacterium]